jgi:CheY-like chemotaxis protein
MAKHTILIVDDEVEILDVLRELSEREEIGKNCLPEGGVN